MTTKTAHPCGCIEEIWGGKKARRECEHGNPFLGKQLGRSVGVDVGDASSSGSESGRSSGSPDDSRVFGKNPGVDSSTPTKGGDASEGGGTRPRTSTRSRVTGAALGTSGGGSEDFKAKPRRRSSLKRTRRKESKAERAARDNFNDKVKARACWFSWHRPCWKCNGAAELDRFGDDGHFVGKVTCPACNGDGKHHCEGRKDAHHLIPKQFIRNRFSHLPEDQLLAILFNPKIGAPICRKAHDRIEAGFDRIYWQDLTDEAIEYVGSLPDFMLLRLEEECPKRPADSTKAAA